MDSLITVPLEYLCLGASFVFILGSALGYKLRRPTPLPCGHPPPKVSDSRADQLRANIIWWEEEIKRGRCADKATAQSMLVDMRSVLKP